MLDIPLILFGGLEGVLCHEQIGPSRPWRPEDRLFGIAIANFAALAIEHHERNALPRPSATARRACDGPSNITDRSSRTWGGGLSHRSGRALHVPEPGLGEIDGFRGRCEPRHTGLGLVPAGLPQGGTHIPVGEKHLTPTGVDGEKITTAWYVGTTVIPHDETIPSTKGAGTRPTLTIGNW